MIIAEFLAEHWSDIVLAFAAFFLLTAKIIPARLAGLTPTYYDTQQQKEVKQANESILDALTRALSFSLLRSFLITMGFKGATTIVLFAVIGVELFFTQTISTNAVVIAIAGILALHFEALVENSEEITLWKVFKFKRKQ